MFENVNCYLGLMGFFVYVMEEVLKESMVLVLEDGRKVYFLGEVYIYKFFYSLYIFYCFGYSILRLFKKGLRILMIIFRLVRYFDIYVDYIVNYFIIM